MLAGLREGPSRPPELLSALHSVAEKLVRPAQAAQAPQDSGGYRKRPEGGSGQGEHFSGQRAEEELPAHRSTEGRGEGRGGQSPAGPGPVGGEHGSVVASLQSASLERGRGTFSWDPRGLLS